MPSISVLQHGSTVWADQGVIGFCSVILIEGENRILVDVGHVGRRMGLEAALQEHGLAPDDIDIAIMSHAHWDHNQNFDLFHQAPLLLHEWERKYAYRPHRNDWATPAWTGAMIETHPSLIEVDEGYEVEPGIRIMHTPGHSPGSITVMVETDDGLSAVTGDVLHSSNVALTRRNPRVFWNEKEATRSIDRILAQADIIYPGHDRPFRVVNGKIEYAVEPTILTIGGLDPSAVNLDASVTASGIWVMEGIEEQTIDSLN